MAQLLGRAKIDFGGKRFRTKKGAKLNIGGIKRTPVVDTDGGVHHTEEYMEATLDCIVLHTSDVDARAIHDATDKTITFIGDNGLTYVMGNAFSTDPPDFTDDGEIPFKFAGNAARKQ